MTDDATIGLLMREHEVILRVVAALDRLARAVDQGRRADPELLREAVRFMREFADRRHHGKEEDLLFPAMADKGIPEDGGPLGVMKAEHVEARAQVSALEAAAEDYATERPGADAAVVAAVRGVSALYPDHIWKEDNVLYPMAADIFSPAELGDLARRFDEVEAEFGEAARRESTDFAERLTRAFPET